MTPSCQLHEVISRLSTLLSGEGDPDGLETTVPELDALPPDKHTVRLMPYLNACRVRAWAAGLDPSDAIQLGWNETGQRVGVYLYYQKKCYELVFLCSEASFVYADGQSLNYYLIG